jgi:voltage-gated potassium channel
MPLFLSALQHRVRHIRRHRELALVGVAILIMVIGAAAFSLTEHITFALALYWAVTSATTVGYGDVTPHSTAGHIVASVVMLTTIPILAAVFALFTGAAALAHIRRFLGMDSRPPEGPFTVVYGSHPIVPRVLDELKRAGDRAVLVAPHKPAGLSDDVYYLSGDPTDPSVIRQSNPAEANRALIASQVDADTLVIAVAVHTQVPQLEVYALTQSREVARALSELGVTHTLSSDELVGHTVAKCLETPSAGDVLLQLVDTEKYRLVESDVDSDLVSQPLSRARDREGTLVLGLCRGGKINLGVDEDPVLAPDDRLILLEPMK